MSKFHDNEIVQKSLLECLQPVLGFYEETFVVDCIEVSSKKKISDEIRTNMQKRALIIEFIKHVISLKNEAIN